MDSSSNRLTVETGPREGILVLDGDIDSHTAGLLEARLAEVDQVDDVVLDLSAVRFIDSSGLRVLLAGHQTREERDKRLVLQAPSSAVARLLEIAGVRDHLHIT